MIETRKLWDLHRRIGGWVTNMFGHDVLMDRRERAMRVLEEAVELAQAEDVPLEMAYRQLLTTYNRPRGHPNQEAAGVMFCLFAWGYAACQNVVTLLEEELWQAERPERMEEIQRKVKAKHDAGLTIANAKER